MSVSLPTCNGPGSSKWSSSASYIIVGLYDALEPVIHRMEYALNTAGAQAVRGRWLDQHFDGPIQLWELQHGGHFIQVAWPE